MAVADKLRELQIKANLIADKRLGLMEIDVEVQDGVATLTGDVTSRREKRRAEELAYEVDGIYEVSNEICVVPLTAEEMLTRDVINAHMGYGPAEGSIGDTAFAISGEYTAPGPGLATSEQFPGEYTDDDVEREVTDKLASQDEVDASKVSFCSANQIVYIKGSVKSADELNRLQDILMNVRGVMGISSEVTVEEGETGTPVG